MILRIALMLTALALAAGLGVLAWGLWAAEVVPRWKSRKHRIPKSRL